MEDRLAAEGRPSGGALIAPVVVLAITVAWWALALWPAGAIEPEWLARTRAACFGSVRGGLPDAGGWILLVGEPLGMLGAIVLLFGRSLRRDLEWVAAHRHWRAASWGLGVAAGVVVMVLGARASGLWAAAQTRGTAIAGGPVRVNREAPAIQLVDQHGLSTDLAHLGGRRVLLTFAYGHCTTVCPAIVTQLSAERRERRLEGVPIVVLTLDPWRDTPDRLLGLAAHWGLSGDDRVMSGSIAGVNQILDELGVGRRRNDTNGDIDHAATVMIIDEGGRVMWREDGEPRAIAGILRKL